MEQLNRVDAIAFYDKYYAPNNAVLVVAGDVDAATVKRLAEETYGKVPRGPDLPPRVRPTEPEQNTKRTVTMRDPRVSVPSFQKSWVVPSYRTAKDGEAEALDLLSEILGGGTPQPHLSAAGRQEGHRLGRRRLLFRHRSSTTPASRSTARRAARPASSRSKARSTPRSSGSSRTASPTASWRRPRTAMSAR